jgi:hypothetical protein
VAAVAGDFHVVFSGVFAILTAVVVVFGRCTFACRMGALFYGRHFNAPSDHIVCRLGAKLKGETKETVDG